MKPLKKKTKKMMARIAACTTALAILVPVCLSPVLQAVSMKSQSQTNSQVDEKLLEAFEESKNESSNFYDVEEILDGATIRVSMEDEIINVRLLGLEIPEEMEESALSYLVKSLADYPVRLEFDSSLSQEKEDEETQFAYVFLPDGTFLNEKLLEEGVAMLIEDAEEFMYFNELQSAENKAKYSKIGVWEEEIPDQNGVEQ